MIGIELDKVCFIILKARQLDVKEGDEFQDDPAASNMSDDNFAEVLTNDVDDATEEELRSIISDLNVDERARLIALTWVGRGDFDRGEWAEAVRTARQEATTPAADYLLGIPNLGDLLAEGLAAFDLSCVGEEAEPDLPEGTPGENRQEPGENMPIRRRGGTATEG
jgi:hypothetical protein